MNCEAEQKGQGLRTSFPWESLLVGQGEPVSPYPPVDRERGARSCLNTSPPADAECLAL